MRVAQLGEMSVRHRFTNQNIAQTKSSPVRPPSSPTLLPRAGEGRMFARNSIYWNSVDTYTLKGRELSKFASPRFWRLGVEGMRAYLFPPKTPRSLRLCGKAFRD